MASQITKTTAPQTRSKRQTTLSLRRNGVKRSVYTESSPSKLEEGVSKRASRRVTVRDPNPCWAVLQRQALSAITNSRSGSQTSFQQETLLEEDAAPVPSGGGSDTLKERLAECGVAGTSTEKDVEVIDVEGWSPGSDPISESKPLSEINYLPENKSLSKSESLSESESPSENESFSRSNSVSLSDSLSEIDSFSLIDSLSESKYLSDTESPSEKESPSASPAFHDEKYFDRKELGCATAEVVDLTGDGDDVVDVVNISCSEASLCPSKSSCSVASTLSEKKRIKIRRRGDVFQGVHCIGQMTELQLRRWLYVKKPLMIELFKGREFSWRHDNFTAGCKKRSTLIHQMDTHHFHKDHVDVITETLMHIFCGKDMKHFSYVMSVLLPECLIRIIADIHKVPFKEAEVMMMDYSGRTV